MNNMEGTCKCQQAELCKKIAELEKEIRRLREERDQWKERVINLIEKNGRN